MTQKTEFVLSARDETRAAFESVNQSLSKMTGASVNLGESFKTIAMGAAGLAGASSIAAFAGQINTAITAMGDLQDAAEKTGASVENLSALKGVAKLSGQDFDTVTDSINRLSKALRGTDDESKGAGKALAAIGLDIQKLRELDPAQAFVEIARAQEKFADGGGKTAALMAIMGKNAGQLIPYMKDLAEQQKLVGKVTAEQAQAADDYGKNLVRLQAGWSSLSRQMAAVIVGPAKDVTDWMVEAQKQGGLLQAVFVGIGAAMTKALGGEINPLKVAEKQANDAFAKVAELRQQFEAAPSSRKGWFGELIPIDNTDLKARLDAAESELRAAIKRRDRLVKSAVDDDKPKDTSLNTMSFGKTGADSSGKKAKDEIAEASDAAKEYGKAMQALAGSTLDANAAQMGLSKTQKVMLDLMQSPTFADMPDTWKATAVEQFEFARAAELAADAQSKLNKLLGETDSSKLEESRRDMQLLADALERGVISEEKYLDAVQKRLQDGNKDIATQKTLAEELGLTFTSAFESAVAGGGNFRSVLKGLEQDIIKLLVRMSVTEPLGNAVKGINWGSIVSGIAGYFSGTPTANAKGGVYESPSLSAYSGQIVSKPTLFAFARGAGLMGEAGPEAILPLKRGSDGRLGVEGGGSNVTVNVINNTDAQARTERRSDGKGNQFIEVIIEQVNGRIAGDIGRGSGPVPAAMQSVYGLQRTAGAY